MPRFHVLTLFPEMLKSPLEESILGKAISAGLIGVRLHNIRDHTRDKHRTADDVPFGGGQGMVMKPEPVVECIESVAAAHAPSRTYLLTPTGRPFDQTLAQELSELESVALVCGRYEGVDERVSQFVDGEISVGDFVLTGGELGALVIIDAVSRLVPGVLGNDASALHESHTGDPLLEHPHYTRPRVFRELPVPEVLLSGNHALIAEWRRRESLVRTRERRPDLFARHVQSDADRRLLETTAPQGRVRAKNHLSTGAKPAIYLALLHHPVYNKHREVVATAVTNVDIHDIARSSRTYGVHGFYLVTPIEQQRALIAEILGHWTEGAGARHNPRRADALSRAEVVPSVEVAVEAIAHRTGARPLLVVTGARLSGELTSYETLRARLLSPADGPSSPAPSYLLLLGTGFGITDEVVDRADIKLAPIYGVDGYNHLSVRSAAAIILDRLLGDRDASGSGTSPGLGGGSQ